MKANIKFYFECFYSAVYEAVERLASLVARIILTPMEESAAIYYSSNMRQSSVNKDVPKKILSNFVALLRLIIVLGIVVCVFGIPYSKIVVQFYGAELLSENDGKFFQLLFDLLYILLSVSYFFKILKVLFRRKSPFPLCNIFIIHGNKRYC